MRYYKAVTMSPNNKVAIVAELAAHTDSETGRTYTYGDEEGISREEVLSLEGGREALSAWESGDDSAFAGDQELMQLVGTAEELFMHADKGDPEAIAFLQANATALRGFSEASHARYLEGVAAAQRHADSAGASGVVV